MKNSLGRFVPAGFKPFLGANEFLKQPRITQKIIVSNNQEKGLGSISEVFDKLNIKDEMTLSFHHHLRNGDEVMNLVFQEIKKRNLKKMTIAPSSIFPNNRILVDLIENGNVTNIYTNYLNGEVARAVSEGKLRGMLYMDTHGGRSYAIESGDIKIDVAFIATPTADLEGNGTGLEGPSACGSLGYAIPDMLYAKKKVVVTDNLVESLENPVIKAKYIDYVLVISKIGEQSGILSGTTQITRDPVGLMIAETCAQLIDELGLIKDGFSMQTGAGGTSLAVTRFVKERMIKKQVKASFASGGITGYYVEMLEALLVDRLYDVQCFDLEAVRSLKDNAGHQEISAITYANPYESAIVNHLDFVILGATEVDLSFNVNVTTAANGLIIGGSGGHTDTAHGAKVSIIVTPLLKSRLPIIRPEVTTITTPGEDVDIIVSERGIAINPKRSDLINKLAKSKLRIVSIEELYQLAISLTGIPELKPRSEQIVGLVRYRDQSIIDTLYKM
ncbi:MAG: citrate lyase subunit alpha [Bacilli bacterium]|nr:citrate lyase subunit alpha [Bacilli bacterium]